ncbi:MAG: hypothetical protein L0Z50_37480, partial [Verrucomicrobiales bacterium]|nr:hypothetical protein [Verrucomicrobiales bacterium]
GQSGVGGPPFDGRYALAFENVRSESNRSITVRQTGDIPADARFLTLRSFPGFGIGVFAISVDDQRFDALVLERHPRDDTIFVLDISAWSGKRVTLSLSPFFDAAVVIDSIAFVPALDWILAISRSPSGNGQPPHVTLGFGVATERDYFVEFRDSLGAESSWQPLPGAPHNSGSVVDPAAAPQRFYRLRSVETTP